MESCLMTPMNVMFDNQEELIYLEEDDPYMPDVVTEEIIFDDGNYGSEGLNEFFPENRPNTFSDISTWSDLPTETSINLEEIAENIDLDFIDRLLHENEEEEQNHSLNSSSSNSLANTITTTTTTDLNNVIQINSCELFDSNTNSPISQNSSRRHQRESSSSDHSPEDFNIETISPRSGGSGGTGAVVVGGGGGGGVGGVFTIFHRRKSPLLPYTIQDTCVINNHNNIPEEFDDNDVVMAINNEDIIHGKAGDRIVLTNIEKKLLREEGMNNFPTHLPLTRSEERLIRLVRRKIRNKKSAKLSRAKKQRYVGDLEERVNACTGENTLLRRRIRELQDEKSTLQKQVERLRTNITNYMRNAGADPSSLLFMGGNSHSSKGFCVVLLIMFAFVISPLLPTAAGPWLDPMNSGGDFGGGGGGGNKMAPYPGRSRLLLSEQELSVDVPAPYEVTIRPKTVWSYPPQSPTVKLSVNNNNRIGENNYDFDELSAANVTVVTHTTVWTQRDL